MRTNELMSAMAMLLLTNTNRIGDEITLKHMKKAPVMLVWMASSFLL